MMEVDLEGGLARFGHESFRPGQREAIETLLDVGRLLLVAPTGGGKSLTYQLPAALLPGTTLRVEFDADNPGRWLTHCHNVYHGGAGMMTTIAYQQG